MSYQGLETLFAVTKNDLKTPADVLVLFLHWKLCKEGYLCTGCGEGASSAGGGGSELLPGGWNATPEVYTLNYKNDKEKGFLLKVVKIGESVSINILTQPEHKLAELTIETKDYVGADLSDYNKAFVNKEDLNKHAEQLLQTFKESENKGEKRSTIEEGPSSSREQQPRRPRVDQNPPDSERIWPPRVGGSDLDPLGRMGGGGMIMDPLQSGPPMRPRWDPVGPLDPDFGGMGGPLGPLGGGGGMGPMGGGGIGPFGGGIGGGPLGGGRGGGGMFPRGGGNRGRHFGDAMRPPGWDNDDMFM